MFETNKSEISTLNVQNSFSYEPILFNLRDPIANSSPNKKKKKQQIVSDEFAQGEIVLDRHQLAKQGIYKEMRVSLSKD